MTELADPATKRILVVDDDESVRDLLEFVVRKEGFVADKAGDGKEALDRIGLSKPDLLLLDLMMPRYGGFEVLRKLQQAPDTADLPIIVISGRFADKGTVEMIRQESNVVEFLEKPIRPPQLLSVVHRILHSKPRTA